ncbi:MAG TPA: division plane positioning ATPase MipZ [Rhizomicrobium sp.]|jgi:chromosome partitioning protein|nr:division plane positioning ATPase MipZ [Rhizomicrobium sp.]
MAHIVVFGNEKGGSGKTTAAIHVAVALAREGRTVGVIDLDVRQRSFSRHLENRAEWRLKTSRDLPMPELLKLASNIAMEDRTPAFSELLASAAPRFEFLVIDTPGADTSLSRAGHAAADTLVTPLNDSFVDFDLLGRLDPATFEIKGPSVYSDFVWDCRKRRLMARKPALDWVVMRNRVASTEARNKKRLGDAITTLAQRIGFRVTKGFGERVIFRELFPMGLTMLDLPQPGLSVSLSMSTLAARQEVRELVHALSLPQRARQPVALAG